MARPKTENPTPGELEVLKILWDRGPSTVRQVMETLNRERKRHYTSFMSLLNTMADKGLVETRTTRTGVRLSGGRQPGKRLWADCSKIFFHRAFEGSASALVARLLDRSSPSEEELKRIHELIDRYNQQ